MLFSSPVFFAFFGVYFLFHLLVPRQYRVYLIVVGSTAFYAWWKLEYIWLPHLLTAIAYVGLRWIEAARTPMLGRRRLAIVIVLLFIPLLFFKYTDFVYRDVLGLIFGFNRKILDVPLPLGISFITFTLTAYIVDTYQRKFSMVRSVATTDAYVLFFPHLIAGPILRPAELIPQLERPRRALAAPFAIGIAIFTLGLVKKVVFADQVAGLVDAAYVGTGMPGALTALMAIYGFSMQIYCDFSGYTDMAIGAALLIGIRLPDNFLRPYGAPSIVDFWRRWHVTLSHWLRDYLYIPLGGNREGPWRTHRNVIITMVLGGLWHGASWNFVVWGFLHGAGITVVHFLRQARSVVRLPSWLCVLITFHFVTALWVFFRAPTLGKALQVLSAPFAGDWSGAGRYLAENVSALMLLAIFFLLHRYDDHRSVRLALRRVRPEIVWPLLAFLWIFALAISQARPVKFIYFDF